MRFRDPGHAIREARFQAQRAIWARRFLPDSFPRGTSGEFITSTRSKIAAAIENDLRGIDVHDGDVAAENLADSNGLKDSLNREVFATHRRVQGQRIADLQRVAIGKTRGESRMELGRARKTSGVGDFWFCVLSNW